MEYVPLADRIGQFWTDDRNREAGTWAQDHEINMAMLATSPAAGEFLSI